MKLPEILAGIGTVIAIWAAGFTVDLIARADAVTSAQWRYLMSVPGGKWTWSALFLTASLTLTYSLATHHTTIRALGYALLALGCGAIAGFYIVAPLIDPGLTTLGYWPWLLAAAAMMFLAVAHAKPRPWLQ